MDLIKNVKSVLDVVRSKRVRAIVKLTVALIAVAKAVDELVDS